MPERLGAALKQTSGPQPFADMPGSQRVPLPMADQREGQQPARQQVPTTFPTPTPTATPSLPGAEPSPIPTPMPAMAEPPAAELPSPATQPIPASLPMGTATPPSTDIFSRTRMLEQAGAVTDTDTPARIIDVLEEIRDKLEQLLQAANREKPSPMPERVQKQPQDMNGLVRKYVQSSPSGGRLP